MILKELKVDTWIGDPTNCYIIAFTYCAMVLPS